jgi:uncharacterized damage-inducible protein DinB
MNETPLGRQFQMNHWAAHANLQGISHEDSLVHPQPAGNCLNWVLGHVVATRNALLAALGDTPVWTEGEAHPYRQGARAPLRPEEARRLEDIVAAYDASQQAITDRFRRLTQEDLSRPHGERGTLGDWLAGISFHEAYHLGQIGLLRRLVGKDGAIA